MIEVERYFSPQVMFLKVEELPDEHSPLIQGCEGSMVVGWQRPPQVEAMVTVEATGC